MALGLLANEERGRSYRWSIKEEPDKGENIGESLLTAVADDIRVSVTHNKVELVIEKHLNA